MDKVVVDRSLDDIPIVDDECEIKVVLSTEVDIIVDDWSVKNVPTVDPWSEEDEVEIKVVLSIVDSTFVDWWIFSVVVVNAVEVINIEEWVCTVVELS